VSPSSTPREPRAPLAGEIERKPFDGVPDDDSQIQDVLLERVDLGGATYELIDWRYARFNGCNLAGSTWRRAHFVDTAFDDCDLANVVLDRCGIDRVRVDRGRMTGLSVSGSTLRDVIVDDALADLSQWRFATVEHAVLQGCRLPHSDWSNAELSNVRFEDCDLAGADFSYCRLDHVAFVRCGFEGVRGVDGLRGAVVDRAALVDLTEPMAVALGISLAE
jgi:uncharacterized protein YjbI with pentapeptide repeats